MSKKKYHYEVTDIDALAAFAPNAVFTETRRRIAGTVVAGLLNAGVTVPGIKLVDAPVKPTEEWVRTATVNEAATVSDETWDGLDTAPAAPTNLFQSLRVNHEDAA